MHPFIAELKKICPQYSVPAAMLMAIRARIEMKRGVENRLGSAFRDGCRGVLLAGRAGTGKTRIMREVFEGLGLDALNGEGNQVGKWVPSAGSTTAVGLLEVLQIFNRSILFLDELGLDTTGHLHVMKQIANGQILHQKHDSLDSTPFTGMVVAATNGIKIPRNNDLEHLLAMLDRFVVIRINAPNLSPNDYLDRVLTDTEPEKPNWELISKYLCSDNYSDLTEAEQNLLRRLWAKKSLEILDETRSQYRNCHYARDIMLFVKRVLGIPEITKSAEAVRVVLEMMNDTIIFNPISIMHLTPLEETIYKAVCGKDEVSLQEIIAKCDKAGISVSVKHIHSIINRMIQNLIVYRTRHGMYSVKKVRRATANNNSAGKSAVVANL